ncbi:MAG: hypothetical protein SOY68_07500 [Fusobacterium varium]|jgi:hypothetical protein|uniref:hypothetical protein n=1 Tax=Fusobacterium varium TaxID=856 RepID=UPI00189839E8|nr:hypothetical protein [Fusobacterium varium]MCI6034247.1 hypothetical protein [Fusobacterium varium]MDY4005740.1 hypothetical protein [Fusobacterium varium]DAK06656.1 MAG TPA: hypothetical protein [Caudoviricetes sp.]
MKKIDAFICGIASIFVYSNNVSANIFKLYPSTFEKNVHKSLQESWSRVGKTIRGAVNKYGSEFEESKK